MPHEKRSPLLSDVPSLKVSTTLCCVSTNPFLAISYSHLTLSVIIRRVAGGVHFLKLLSFYQSYISSPAVCWFPFVSAVTLSPSSYATGDKIFYQIANFYQIFLLLPQFFHHKITIKISIKKILISFSLLFNILNIITCPLFEK